MLRRPSGSLNPGGFNYAVYLERQGIDAIATVTGSEAVQFLESGRMRMPGGRFGINSIGGEAVFVSLQCRPFHSLHWDSMRVSSSVIEGIWTRSSVISSW